MHHLFSSWLASAIFLSLPMRGEARVAQHKMDPAVEEDKAEDDSSRNSWTINKVFKKRQGVPDECSFPNSYFHILNSTKRGDEEVQIFCNRWLGLPPAVVNTTITPTV